jgi:hypothetical protein
MAKKSYKYKPRTVKKILDKLREGMPKRWAAAYGGISYNTILSWYNQYPDFAEKVDKAEAESIEADLEVIKDKGGWVGRAWRLERVHKGDFSVRQEVTGNDGLPVQFSVKVLSTPQRTGLIDATGDRLGKDTLGGKNLEELKSDYKPPRLTEKSNGEE